MDHPGTQGRTEDAHNSRNCPVSIGLVVAAISQICAVGREVVGEKQCVNWVAVVVSTV